VAGEDAWRDEPPKEQPAPRWPSRIDILNLLSGDDD